MTKLIIIPILKKYRNAYIIEVSVAGIIIICVDFDILLTFENYIVAIQLRKF